MTESDIKMPPFSVIPKHTAEEVDANDLVMTKDARERIFVHFIDLIGRLWMLPLDDCIVIRNNPTKNDLDHFIRLKFEAEQSQEAFQKAMDEPPKKPVMDMAIG